MPEDPNPTLAAGDPLEAIVAALTEALYVNEEGKLLHLPVNQRATTLAWHHNRRLRGRDLLVGDAVLVGPTDRRGNDTTPGHIPPDARRRHRLLSTRA